MQSRPATPIPTRLALVGARPLPVGPVLSTALPASQPAARVATVVMMGWVAQAVWRAHQQAMSRTVVEVVLPVATRVLEVVAADPLAQVALALPLLLELQLEQPL